MACPFFNGKNNDASHSLLHNPDDDSSVTSQSKDETHLTYTGYMKLREILSAQEPWTKFHDEHLFITTHQTFELWFKQILFEISSVRQLFEEEYLEETTYLIVIARLGRVARILQLLCSEFGILDTMVTQDFHGLRKIFGSASGYDSFQFRMIEIGLGVREDLRIQYNQKKFDEGFFGEEKDKIEKTKNQKSLLSLVNDWLERTPGLEKEGFNFFDKFRRSVEEMLEEEQKVIEECCDPMTRKDLRDEYERRCKTFSSLFDIEIHEDLVKKGQRRLSHRALQGALLIYLYKEKTRYRLPFQITQALIDIDVNFAKLRHSHLCTTQRMIGVKGSASGYLYLRSTCSDRYKVFLDFMNLSMFVVTVDRIPPLVEYLKAAPAIHSGQEEGLPTRGPPSYESDTRVETTICEDSNKAPETNGTAV